MNSLFIMKVRKSELKITNKKKALFNIGFFSLAFIVSLLLVVSKWFTSEELDGVSLFLCFIFLHLVVKELTWGLREEEATEEDELDRHIKSQSSKISYYFLLVSSFIILYFFSDSSNTPLIVLVGLIFVTLPITEFVYSRKYRKRLKYWYNFQRVGLITYA